MKEVLNIKDFNLLVREAESYSHLLTDVNLKVGHKEIVGLVGPSGSGKTMTINSILQLVQYQNKTFKQEGQILLNGADLTKSDSLSRIRNEQIGIIFQQSAQIFNPSQKIGKQLLEKLVLFTKYVRPKSTVLETLKRVQLKEADRIYNSYPHELSGGQLQRCLIALAIINKPQLLIADEPFSSLDDDTQEELISVFMDLRENLDVSILLVSHNKTLVKRLSQRIYSIEKGVVNESHVNSSKDELLQVVSSTVSEKPLVQIIDLKRHYKNGLFQSKTTAVLNGVTLTINKGEILGLYGKSGGGKSTLARLLTGLEKPSEGQIYYNGRDVGQFSSEELSKYKTRCQIIFQDSLSSMSPHRTVRQQLADVYYVQNRDFDNAEVGAWFKALSLDNELLSRYRHELSGGQRQRIMIVRALILGVELLICDEILASLDEEVGFKLRKQLLKINLENGLTVLFISHNKTILKEFCNRIISLDTINPS